MTMRWYVVQAYSQYENSVKRALEDRISRSDIADKFGQILVPSEEVTELKDGQRRKMDRKFFPGYVLVQIDMCEPAWHLVKETPKVIGFVGGTAERPMAITDREAETILQRMEEGVTRPKPKVMFEPGELVRIIEGPFKDFSAVVEDAMYERNRLKVSVSIFGRSTPVELEFSQVEKS